MKTTSHKKLSRILSLIFSFMLVGLFAHHTDAKQKSSKRSPASSPRPQKTQTLSQAPEEKLQEEKIQEEMEKYLGVRYKRGGISTKGFDCSGFVKQIYSEVFDVDLPHQSSEQNQCSLLAKAPPEELKTGDLVFFSTGRNRKGINHVGIYLSDGKFIHSARTKGVVISSLEDTHWKTRLVSSKRLASRDSIMASLDSKTAFGLGTAPDEKSLFTFQLVSAQLSSYPPSLVHNELLQFSGESYYRTEFNFLQSLWVDSWSARLTAFREHFTVAQDDPFFAPRSILGGSDLSYNPFSATYSQGLKVASDFQPNDWVRVSPSVTYFDYGSGIDLSDQPRVALGLDFALVSSSDGWSLSTGFQYPLSRYASTRFSENETLDTHVVDMSLTFRQRLSDHIQFSVTGERFYRYSYGSKGSPYGLDGDDHQVTFALQFFY
jgi:murein DD-endopeptidase / murein LD-carboxypeptidase